MTAARAGLGGRDLLLVLVICVAWALNFLTSAWALAEIPPFLFTAIRLVILALLLAPFIKAPTQGQWPLMFAVALSNGVLHFGLSFWSLQLAGNLSSPAIVMQSYVPMAALLAWWWLGERFGWRTGLAIATSFGGVLVLGFDPMVLQAPASLVLMLVSAVFLATGTVLMRKLKGVDMFSAQGWTAIIGLGPLLALSAWLEPGSFAGLRDATWIGWGGAAYSAIGSSLLGHGLLCGIGFTMSLFIASLAYHDVRYEEAVLGVLAASVIAATLGMIWLRAVLPPARKS